MVDDGNNLQTLGALRRAVEQLQRQLAAVASAAGLANHPILGNKVFLAKIGDGGAWREQSLPAGTFGDLPDGRSGDGTGAEQLLDMAAGTIAVLMVRDQDAYRYVKLGGGTRVLVPVKLTDDGSGANGSATTAPTYAYDVKDLDDNALASGLSPVTGRCVGLTTGPALWGEIYYDSDGTIVLWRADELPAGAACSPTG